MDIPLINSKDAPTCHQIALCISSALIKHDKQCQNEFLPTTKMADLRLRMRDGVCTWLQGTMDY